MYNSAVNNLVSVLQIIDSRLPFLSQLTINMQQIESISTTNKNNGN